MRADPGGPGWAWTFALVANIALCIVLATRVRVGSPPSIDIDIDGVLEPCWSEPLDRSRE